MEKINTDPSLDALTNELRRKRNGAIETLYSFITSHQTGEELDRKRLDWFFINARMDYDREATPLTAKDCKALAGEEDKELEAHPNNLACEKVVQKLKKNLEPYSTDPGLEESIRESFNIYISSFITGSKNESKEASPQISAPIDEEKPEQEKGYIAMVHGEATDALAGMSSKGVSLNPVNKSLEVTYKGVKYSIANFNDIAGALGVSTHKLLSMGMIGFTQNNHVGNGKRVLQNLEVTIPLKEYATLTGYDVTEHETSTPEEARKEKARAEGELRNARKEVAKDLQILRNSTLSWKEKKWKGKARDFMDVGIVASKGIVNGEIYMSFSQEMGDYMVELPLTQYSMDLFKVDGRNQNAYTMGLAMVEHSNMDSNIKNGTANILRVSTLLSYTKLPGINDSTVKKKGWRDRIKEPFENALDVLVDSGVIEDWYYSHSKGVRLTDEEAMDFKNYGEWENTLVYYTLRNAPDHTARLARRNEEKLERQEKKKSRPVKRGSQEKTD